MTAPAWRALLGDDVVAAGRSLLGCELTDGTVTLRLTEVEAYHGVGVDPASHAFRGRTGRNWPMFGEPGFAYVYFVFGMHWCLNVVCRDSGVAGAILIRAAEVIGGTEEARRRRGASVPDHQLARGPGRLTVALGVEAAANATPLLDGDGPLTLSPARRRVPASRILTGPRVGVAGGADLPWRFWLAGEPSVSAYRPHIPRRRSPTAQDRADPLTISSI